MLLEGLRGLGRDPGAAFAGDVPGHRLPGPASGAPHDQVGLGLGPFADPRGPGLARTGRARRGSPVPHPADQPP